jgi:hypothetical protein
VRGLIAGFILSLSLYAQTPAWQVMPSHGTEPDVHYRLREEGQGLRLDIRAENVDQGKWALHLWMGDPRIVEARQKHLGEVQTAIREEEKLLQDKDHHDDYCQASLHTFLGKAYMARSQFKKFDPYTHVRLSFQPADDESGDLRQLTLAPGKDKSGLPIFSVTIPFKGDFDSAGPQIETLSYGLVYLPREDRGLPGLRYPHLFHLKQPWKLEPFFADWTARFRILLGTPEADQAYLKGPTGYEIGHLNQVSEVACSGAEGIFTAPEIWSPWPRGSETNLPSDSNRFKFSFVKGRGTYLAVQGADLRDPVVLDLHTYLSSLGEEGIEVLDCIDTPSGTSLRINVSGWSNPGGGGGQCGAGSQEDMLLLRLAPSGKLSLAKGFNMVSCDESTGTEFGNDNADGTWTWWWNIRDRRETHTASYDPNHPELGLTEKVEPSQGD